MIREKILTWPELKKMAAELKASGKKIVFTAGGFDVLHLGQIRYLERAKRAGDILVVGVTADESEKKEKGAPFPLLDEKMRAETVAFLRGVDYVLIGVDKSDLRRPLRTLQPDVFFTVARDWEKGVRRKEEAELVESRGGRVERCPYLKPYLSSTDLAKKLAYLKIRSLLDKHFPAEVMTPLLKEV